VCLNLCSALWNFWSLCFLPVQLNAPVSLSLVLNPSFLPMQFSARDFEPATLGACAFSQPRPCPRTCAQPSEPVLSARRVQLNYARIFEPVCSTTAVHLLKYKQHDRELLHKL